MEEIVKAEGAAIAPTPKDLVVIATNPAEMAGAQHRLIGWFTQKLEVCKAELAEAKTNFDLAKSRKWRTEGWSKLVVKAQHTVEYYQKALAAVNEGYCIVPDFPVEIIAIRTSRRSPRDNYEESSWGYPNVKDQATNSPAKGQGEYVSPQTLVERGSYENVKDGKTEKVRTIKAVDFLPPDFPYKTVKPKILDDASRAMALKIFDEIAVVSRPRRSPDPIVVGRVTRRVDSRSTKSLSFLISWWIDVEDL